MAKPIFRVNLAQGAPDFQHMATEPGLAMLDRAGANYEILKRWLGDFVAEPQWRGETLVEFFVTEEKRGRLENVNFSTVRKQDLQKGLKEDLDTLGARIKKIRPESTNEQILHRILSTTYKRLTDNLDHSEFDCYLFQYREGREAMRLIWCWGYQRTDQQPLPALVCTDESCNQLFVRRPQNPGICPGCQSVVRRKRRKIMKTVLSSTSALMFLALSVLFVMFNLPRLEVSPAEWIGPVGARATFKVHYKRWYFLNDDVTNAVIPQSLDSRVLEFDKRGSMARAKKMGRTNVTFQFLNYASSVAVQVGPVKEPESLTIEPSDAHLAVGSTARLRVMGNYKDQPPVDLTEVCAVEVQDEKIAFAHDEYLEGATEGATSYRAVYRWDILSKPKEAKGTVKVEQRTFTALELACNPTKLMIGENGQLTINAIDSEQKKWSVLGSTQLENELLPETVAELDREFVVGKGAGTATLTSKYLNPELSQTLAITVTNESAIPPGMFAVSPTEVTELFVGNSLSLNVVSSPADGAVTSASSDVAIVEVDGSNQIVGRKPGQATVTVTQGAKSATVKVTVVDAKYDQLRIEPKLISMAVGKKTQVRVFGVIAKKGADGGILDFESVELAPSALEWAQEPLKDNADFNRDTMQLYGLRPTKTPQKLVAVYKTLSDEADIEITGDATLVASLEEDEFLAYPPLAYGSTFGVPGLVYDKGGVVIRDGVAEDSLLAGLPRGTVVTEINGQRLEGLDARSLASLLGEARLNGATITYRGLDGVLANSRLSKLGLTPRFPVKILDVVPENSTEVDFQVKVDVAVLEAAEYRLLDGAGNPLSQYAVLDANSRNVLRTSTNMLRNANDVYEIKVERRLGTEVRVFAGQGFSVKNTP